MIDEKALQKLAELGERSGKPLLQDLIRLFEQESSTAVEKMKKYSTEKKIEDLLRIAHSQKSSAATLGALRLRDIAEKLEKSAPETSWPQLNSEIELFDQELKIVCQELKRFL